MKSQLRLMVVLLLSILLAACGGETGGGDDGGLDEGEAGGDEPVLIGPDSLNLTDMSTFPEIPSDYTMLMVFNFRATDTGGEPIDSTLTIDGLFREDPFGSRADLMVTGGGDLGDVDALTWVDTGEAVYFYNEINGCVILPSEEDSPYNDFVDAGGFLIGDAQRVMPDEDINGVPSYAFALTNDNLEPTDPASMDVHEITAGRIYVAQDGGYVTRLYLEGRGVSQVLTQSDTLVGDITYQLDFTPATGVTITLPEGCEGADNAESDYPMLDDAYAVSSLGGLLQYSTDHSFDDVVAFYQEAMVAAGWSLDGELIAGNTALLNFSMGDEAIIVAINQQPGGPVTVTIGGE